jgi:hypothetical protein
MRGNPLIRLFIAIAVFLLLGIPVWKLTRAQESEPVASSSVPPPKFRVKMSISLDYEVVPKEFHLKFAGGEFSAGPPQGVPHFILWSANIPEGGSDILVSASWADANRHALRVTFTGPEIVPTDKTFWFGPDAMSDVVHLNLAR